MEAFGPHFLAATPIGLAARALHAMEAVSLDVAMGVLGAAAFLGSLVPGARAPLPVLVCLAAAVTVVYNLDHLLDARETDPGASPRRRRYAENRGVLAVCLVASASVGAVAVWFLPSMAWKLGAALGAYQILYFAGLRAGLRGPAKRLMATTGWALGLTIPAWCLSGPASHGEILLGTGLLLVVGWINLQSYALVDAGVEEDRGDLPGGGLRGLAMALAVAGLGWGFHSFPGHGGHWIALGAVAALQWTLTRLPSDFVHPAGEWSLALLGLFALAT